MTVRELAHAIVDSPKHMQRFYNPNEGVVANERAVANLYRHLLGRQPDAGGLRAYTEMAASKGIEAVAHSILASDEYSRTFGDWLRDPICSNLGLRLRRRATAAIDEAARPRNAQAQMRFADLDRNHDGVIARREWRGTRAEMGSASNPTPFATMDTNGDGRITLGEWPYSHRSFDQQDDNGDGLITPQEFNVNALPSATGR